MTGLYPDRAGVPGVIRQNASDSWGHLRRDVATLPELLKSQGYATFMVGKWHLGYEKPHRPVDRGFESFRGFLGDMMDDYFDHRRGGINWMRENESEIDPKGHATDLFSDWAVEAIRSGTALLRKSRVDSNCMALGTVLCCAFLTAAINSSLSTGLSR